jgi:hypothetical protein
MLRWLGLRLLDGRPAGIAIHIKTDTLVSIRGGNNLLDDAAYTRLGGDEGEVDNGSSHICFLSVSQLFVVVSSIAVVPCPVNPIG